MGYVPAGFYGGVSLGRLLLASPTHRFGESKMLLLYTVLCLAMQLVFWLVPNVVSGAVAFSVMGFFLGPFFAAVSFLFLLLGVDVWEEVYVIKLVLIVYDRASQSHRGYCLNMSSLPLSVSFLAGYV